ncbi:hypothetical protein SNOG_03072 [Parastagonospora nodorum SN15]|uniref:Uncharacterized protein n=1 Tax=Phaeosphaeria nodorum (strain SN15 / ATCC MYA-4574 / FGSC 10173) TaxID=321614 RepID=Q0UYU2_PHANO|nr:hypothetical protein SNOG_03072 [Parastagonospora nodorum SN15]EAT89803.1 hypothetical protein SNOG_03072 [Parastagonospora nodorum SN15]
MPKHKMLLPSLGLSMLLKLSLPSSSLNQELD